LFIERREMRKLASIQVTSGLEVHAFAHPYEGILDRFKRRSAMAQTFLVTRIVLVTKIAPEVTAMALEIDHVIYIS
jgi:hypothetical protein